MSLADRILVMFEGRVMGELAQADATAERLGLLMAGSAAGTPTTVRRSDAEDAAVPVRR
jgi:ABC-type sugar transport system ATPase subunit